ncbi:acid protease [Coniophora puteana RWD-64-598 SS2]|uniref:Acid protease n=1 Tax=Coniophora puteana (strain RWD-64-598) TaxID=741705 RepID=R7SG50_CONPW|nr:acid protease [Coniophora puteana RWD-64-598 SS2]EIW74697.1 acid protease [Coniophora puteana RWD-64-598 SS2]
MRSLTSLPLLFALLADAATLPFHVHSPNSFLQSRQSSTSTNGTIPVGNTQNSFYYSNITLGGRTISVMLDTGSSDLWVTGSVPSTTNTGKSVTLSYAVGQAKGNINTATFQFGGYTVNDQAFLLVTDTSSFSTNIHAEGYDGLLGLGPNTGSSIYKELDNASGNSPMNRIFQNNASNTNNYITLLLNRQNDPASTNVTGQFTIGEIVPGYEAISNMPQVAIEKVYKLTDQDQHWQVLTDKDKGIIGPDGQPIQADSIVPKAPDGQLVAVFDSGYTLPQVPRDVSDAIYGRVQGAEWSAAYGAWLIPCGQLVNITINIGGNAYPVHPLDASSSDFGVTFANGGTACLGTFQPVTSAFSLLGEYDMILGMAFLRNTYTLINFGSMVSSGSTTAPAYAQLLSTTNWDQAVQDFIAVRQGGQNQIGAAQYALLPAGQEQHSPESAAEKKAHYEEEVLSRWPYILAGCIVFVVLVVGLCVWRCCKRRRARRARAAAQAGASTGGGGGAGRRGGRRVCAAARVAEYGGSGDDACEPRV